MNIINKYVYTGNECLTLFKIKIMEYFIKKFDFYQSRGPNTEKIDLKMHIVYYKGKKLQASC